MCFGILSSPLNSTLVCSTILVIKSKYNGIDNNSFLIPDCTFIIKKELLSIPLYGLYLRKLKYVAINRGKASRENSDSFAQVFDLVLKSNRTLIIFPQGTRVKFDEQPQLKKGASRIYQGLNIACLPVKLNTGSSGPKIVFLNIQV